MFGAENALFAAFLIRSIFASSSSLATAPSANNSFVRDLKFRFCSLIASLFAFFFFADSADKNLFKVSRASTLSCALMYLHPPKNFSKASIRNARSFPSDSSIAAILFRVDSLCLFSIRLSFFFDISRYIECRFCMSFSLKNSEPKTPAPLSAAFANKPTCNSISRCLSASFEISAMLLASFSAIFRAAFSR